MVWVQFVVCAFLVVLVGSRLSFYGDVIAEKSGLGRLWIGAVLIGGVTSLPELATGLSAVILVKRPNLAAGGIFGSCLFNLLILALMDGIYRGGPLLSAVSGGQILSASLSLLMMALAALSLLLASKFSIPSFLGFQVPSILILLAYLIGYRIILSRERRVFKRRNLYPHVGSSGAYLWFFIMSVVMVALAVWLAYIGNEISRVTGWGCTFVGLLFLAVVTSLPELVVSFTAVRLGAPDLAVGNVFGSNAFNVAILAFFDFAYRGDFWHSLATSQLLALTSAMGMTGLTLFALTHPKRRAFWGMGWESPLLILIYLVTSWFLFVLRKLG